MLATASLPEASIASARIAYVCHHFLFNGRIVPIFVFVCSLRSAKRCLAQPIDWARDACQRLPVSMSVRDKCVKLCRWSIGRASYGGGVTFADDDRNRFLSPSEHAAANNKCCARNAVSLGLSLTRRSPSPSPSSGQDWERRAKTLDTLLVLEEERSCSSTLAALITARGSGDEVREGRGKTGVRLRSRAHPSGSIISRRSCVIWESQLLPRAFQLLKRSSFSRAFPATDDLSIMQSLI